MFKAWVGTGLWSISDRVFGAVAAAAGVVRTAGVAPRPLAAALPAARPRPAATPPTRLPAPRPVRPVRAALARLQLHLGVHRASQPGRAIECQTCGLVWVGLVHSLHIVWTI